ncbi:MAG: hypothetical protein IPK82_37850 [Polyangiaceae bacterium]|nr:hypothetical protein [Polyangiaceae bacterium]
MGCEANPPSSTGGSAGSGASVGGQTASSTGGTGGGTTTSTTGGGGTGGIPGCKSDAECPGIVCDLTTGDCVPCTPEKDICPPGQYCKPSNQCEVGCTDNSDCNVDTVCDTDKHACVGCLIDTNCPVGSICVGETCIPGCSGVQPCQPGFSCCGQLCFDLANDLQNCGFCNNACPTLPNAVPACQSSMCTLGTCVGAYVNCNLDPADGCEHNSVADGPCSCTPGEKQSCYSGAPGTLGIGTCQQGERTCIDGASWTPCIGQVLPKPEQCNGLDDDCNGTIEPQPCEQCQPNTGSCNGNVAHGCKDDGLGYVDEVCDALQGTTCNPNTGKCDGACGLSSLGQSYIGCDYWPTVTANLVSTTFHFGVAVSNTTAQAATVTITKGAATVSTATVAPNSVQVIQMPWELTLKGPTSGSVVPFPASVKVTQGAYRLRSTQPVTVYQFNPIEYTLAGQFSYSNDASILLPVNVWTGKYRVAARHHFVGGSGFYSVTAREDNTTVTVAAGPSSGLVKSGIAGINTNGNGSVVINAGDVLEVVTNGGSATNDPNDVTGTLVTADKAVQVIGGHSCVYIPHDTPYCDHIEESMFPEQTLSNTYLVTAPLIPTGGMVPKVNIVRVVATKPNTTLTYDPPQPGAPAMIAQAGQWVEMSTTADFQITGSEPILVVQYMTGQNAGGGSGDPAMTVAVGKEQYRKSYLLHAPTNYEYSYINIVAPTGSTVTLDGTALAAAAFTAIGNSGFSVARATLSNAGNGNHTLSSPAAFGIAVYGYGQYTSYWYPGGSNLTKLHE